jgi:hypothetical protein
MNTLTSKPILTGILFLITLGSGLLVSNAGRPLHSGLFGLHKLVALATTILLGFSLYRMARSGDTLSALVISVLVLTAVLFLALFASGVLMSFEWQFPGVVLRIHQVAPLLALAVGAASVYLLFNSQV